MPKLPPRLMETCSAVEFLDVSPWTGTSTSSCPKLGSSRSNFTATLLFGLLLVHEEVILQPSSLWVLENRLLQIRRRRLISIMFQNRRKIDDKPKQQNDRADNTYDAENSLRGMMCVRQKCNCLMTERRMPDQIIRFYDRPSPS